MPIEYSKCLRKRKKNREKNISRHFFKRLKSYKQDKDRPFSGLFLFCYLNVNVYLSFKLLVIL